MSISAIVIVLLLLVYGVYSVYNYLRNLLKNKASAPGTRYFELQGLLSGVVSLFLAMMILIGGIKIDLF